MIDRVGLAIVLLAATACPAAAHSPIKGVGTFYSGLLHPALVPAHLLALIAVGLLIGQNVPASRWRCLRLREPPHWRCSSGTQIPIPCHRGMG